MCVYYRDWEMKEYYYNCPYCKFRNKYVIAGTEYYTHYCIEANCIDCGKQYTLRIKPNYVNVVVLDDEYDPCYPVCLCNIM